MDKESTKNLSILVATNHLHSLGGSETFTYALIEALIELPNVVVEYFTFKKGIVSDKIENQLKVNFSSKGNYDLILANHYPVVEELYGKGFIIQTCHGIFHKLEKPNTKANAFVSISQEVQNYLAEINIPSKIIHNGIDLKRFRNTNSPNKELKVVLSLCQSEEANQFIHHSCDSLSLEFLKADKNIDAVWDVNTLINKSDLVVGLGRSAYEAMACGRPVIVYDNRKYFESCGDGYVRDMLGLSIRNNCSGRYSLKNFDTSSFIKEIKKYNADDGLFFRNFAEKELDVRKNVQEYISYFENVSKVQRKSRRIEKNRRRKAFLEKIIGKRTLSFLIKKYRGG